MRLNIFVVFAFILHIYYLHLCKATKLYCLFAIILYWSKVTFMVYMCTYTYTRTHFSINEKHELELQVSCLHNHSANL